MKDFRNLLLLIFSLSVFAGCVGPEGVPGQDGLPGPRGPQGPQGPQGPSGITTLLMYEIQFNLNSSTNWMATYNFPVADEIFVEDAVLVYYLWEVVDGKDVWRLMPVTFFYDEGVQMINYDYTVDNVRIFVESQFALDPAVDYYNNVIARVVIVPADYSPNARKATVDFNDFEAVKAAYGLNVGNTSLNGTPLKNIVENIKNKR